MTLIVLCTCFAMLALLIGYASQKKMELPTGHFTYDEVFVPNKFSIVLFAIVLITVSTLRYGFIDTAAYKEVYVNCRNDLLYVNSYPYDIEKWWTYFCYYLNYLTPSPKILLFICAALIITAYCNVIVRYSQDPLFSLFLFFCLTYLDTNNGIRQMFAAALVMLAYPLLNKHKLWAYVLYGLIVWFAMQFHESVVVCFLIIIVAIGKPFNIRTKLALLFGVVFVLFPDTFNGLIGDVFEESKYTNYLNFSSSYGMSFTRGLVTGVIPLVLAFVYYKKCKKHNIEIPKDEGLLINLTVINSMFTFMALFMQYWARFCFYTNFAPMILIPKFIKIIFPEKLGKFVSSIAIILYFLFFCYNVYSNYTYGALDAFYASWD